MNDSALFSYSYVDTIQNTSNATYSETSAPNSSWAYDDPILLDFWEWGIRGQIRGTFREKVLPWISCALGVLFLGACFLARRYRLRLRQMQAEKQRLEYDLRLMSNEHGQLSSYQFNPEDSNTAQARSEIVIALTQVSVAEDSTSARPSQPPPTRPLLPSQPPPQPMPPRVVSTTIAPSDGTASELEAITTSRPLRSPAFAGAGYPLLPEFAQEVSSPAHQ